MPATAQHRRAREPRRSGQADDDQADTVDTQQRAVHGGALVCWETGSRAGHVAISMGDGTVTSNDILRKGTIDIVPLARITKDWGATYQGWTSPYFLKAAG